MISYKQHLATEGRKSARSKPGSGRRSHLDWLEGDEDGK